MPINRLIAGFKSFRQTYFEGRPEIYRDLVQQGQHPEVMVIACSDSRVNPSIITEAVPGQIFVVRNVANLVPPYTPDGHPHDTAAALEYAVRDLQVDHIVVLGHTHCGGIKRLCDGAGNGPKREFIDDWVKIAKAARGQERNGEDYLRAVERNAVANSLDNLRSYPWVKAKLDSGDIEIHGLVFDLDGGNLHRLADKGRWEAVLPV